MAVLATAIDKLNSTIGKTIGALENIRATSEKAQQATLSLGQSLGGSFASLGTSMDDLNGSFGQRLQVGIAGMAAGLQGNTTSILSLLNEQQLLGQQFKVTAKVFAKFETSLGLSRDQSASLATTLSETSRTFGVSISMLVKTLDGIKNLPGLRAAGLGDLPEVVAKVAGSLGPALQPALSDVLNLFTDSSMKAFTKLTQLGIGASREEFAAATTLEQKTAIFTRAIKTAGETVAMFDQDSENFFAGQSRANDLFGETANALRAINENLGDRAKIEDRNKGLFTQQLNVLKNNLFAPFQMIFSQKVFPQLSKFVSILAEGLNPFLQSLADNFRSVQSSSAFFNKALEVVNSVIQGVVIALNSMILTFNAFMLGLKIVMIPLIPVAFVLKKVAGILGSIFEGLFKLLEKINNFFGGFFQFAVDYFGATVISQLDPEMFDLMKAQERLLASIVTNTDPENKKVQNLATPSNALREAMKVLDDTLFQISREAVQDNTEQLNRIADATEATATRMELGGGATATAVGSNL
jgi:hypothetical protein